MIILEEGSKENPPYVQIEISPGMKWFDWWYEVNVWDPNNEHEGKKLPCWVHHWQRDDGGFGLWFVWRKARRVLSDVWFEEFEKIND